MRCVLTANVPVERFAACAEFAWLERRPELGALCRAARDAGQRISAEVVTTTLPGVTEAGAKNVVAWCRGLALCDANGALTQVGETVADCDEAPVPEQGTFDLWFVSHPLLGARALHAERITSKQDGRFDEIVPLPTPPTRATVFRSSVEPASRFVVRAWLPANPGPSGQRRHTDARCRVRWTMDFATGREQFALDGVIDGPRGAGRPIRHEAERADVDLESVLRAWALGPLATFGRWDHAQRRLAVRFDALTVDEQEGFAKNLQLAEVEVDGRGTWKNVPLENVPIGPISADDAARWASARLDRHLRRERRYRTRGDVRTLFASVTEGTPLAAHRPALATHDDLLSTYAPTPAVFWGLAASADLAPDSLVEVMQ